MKRTLITLFVVVASIAITATVVYAAGMTADWLRVGSQEGGGVTFFNGTILNDTTDTDGNDNPVTFGDNVRIDGRIFRGATAGAGDTKPFIVNDDMEVVGDTTVGGDVAVTGDLTVGGSPIARKAVYTGTLDLTAAGDEIVNVDQNPLCEEDSYTETTDYHWAKIAVPELDLSDMPQVTVYNLENDTVWGQPESGMVWEEMSNMYIKFGDGYVYWNYKDVNNVCDGSITSTAFPDSGQYKIVVIY